MSAPITPPAKDAVPQVYVVAAPHTTDVISGALRAAFGRQDARIDDFAALLRQIDIADRDTYHC